MPELTACHSLLTACHSLLKAIACVNRVFKDKTNVIVVDDIGIASKLKNTLKACTNAKSKGQPTQKFDAAYKVLHEKMRGVRAAIVKNTSIARR
ncbi:MAG: hypothetical protein AAFP90_18420 [Planctomycetota bacterium]